MFLREIGGTGGDSHTLAIQVPARFPYHRLSMGTRWVLGHLVVSTSGSTTSHYLLARYSTDRGPRAYTQTSYRVLSLSSSSRLLLLLHLFLIFVFSIFFFLSFFFLPPPLSLSLHPSRFFPRSDHPLISFSLFFFFFLLTPRELKRGLTTARQDLFAKTQRVIFVPSAIASFTVIDTSHCRNASCSMRKKKDKSHASCDRRKVNLTNY